MVTKAADGDGGVLIPDPVTSLSAYLAALQSALVPPTRHAASLPGPSDLAFHRSVDKKVAHHADQAEERVEAITRSIHTWAAELRQFTASKGKAASQAITRAQKEDQDEDKDEHTVSFSTLAELVDGLLEEADICMDQYTGKTVIPAGSSSAATAAPRSTHITAAAPTRQPPTRMGKLPAELANAQMDPPQRNFTHKPDNSTSSMWDRQLTFGKPNALLPRSSSPPSTGPSQPHFEPGTVRQGMYCAEGDPADNPYYHEIFQAQPPVFVYQPPSQEEVQPPPPLIAEVPQGVCGVPFTWIDTAEGVQLLAEHLQEERVKEIAIDLEAHAYRSYQGIACLMQLSTRWGDYILDLLSDPVRLNTERLNTSFTDPEKVKILHGAEHDILWLQRDCGLYLVNLFDTYHATNVLQFPAHGLAYLLSKYYDFEADKRYQLADWRIRPLPKEMLYYARSDTHSLIYIYHRLRQEVFSLGGKPMMDEIFNRSKITSARRYAKEIWDEQGDTREGWRSLWRRMGGEEARGTDRRQEVSQMGRTERLLRRLHQWRDQVAREEDESPKYILNAQNLLNLASRAPMTKAEALTIFSPGIPPVRKRAAEVARLIKEEVLAWEQNQLARDVERTAQMNQELASSKGTAATTEEAEDLGTATAPTQTPTEETARRTHLNAPTVNHSLWSSQSSPAVARPVMRSSHSSLFGTLQTNSGASESKRGSVQPAASLQSSLMGALQSVVGSVGSFVGGGKSVQPEDLESISLLPTLTDSAKAEDVNGLVSAEEQNVIQDRQPQQTPSSTKTASVKNDDEVREYPSSSREGRDATLPNLNVVVPSSSPPSSAADEAYDTVQVKKKKDKKLKHKTSWSKAEKRKAKENRAEDAFATSVVDDNDESTVSATNKKARLSSSKVGVRPFDYSSAHSILDAPLPSNGDAGSGDKEKKKAIRKGKRDRSSQQQQQQRDDVRPDRFADMAQPKDRTGLNGAGKSFTFR